MAVTEKNRVIKKSDRLQITEKYGSFDLLNMTDTIESLIESLEDIRAEVNADYGEEDIINIRIVADAELDDLLYDGGTYINDESHVEITRWETLTEVRDRIYTRDRRAELAARRAELKAVEDAANERALYEKLKAKFE